MNLRHQAVGAYRPWEPPAFDQPAAEVKEEEVLTPSQPSSPPIPDEVEVSSAGSNQLTEDAPALTFPTVEEIERLHEETRASAHAEGYAAGREEGYNAGFSEGREAGYAEGKAETEAQIDHFRTLVNNFQQSLSPIDDEVAQELLALSIEIARKMVQDTLKSHPDSIVETIRSALQQLPQVHIQIALNPEDLEIVRGQLGEHNLRLIEDETVTRGGCLIQTPSTQLDATIETRWRRILESLGQTSTAWNTEDEHPA